MNEAPTYRSLLILLLLASVVCYRLELTLVSLTDQRWPGLF